ncbi:MAG TPA: sigma-54 dependent transcriptional regulator [Rhodocyclaceae bacterium]|nr:sigma-54 dependent transcriptional regulator [Rhodocyclaceae bacterium]
MARNKILIVDDEAGVRFGVRDFLEAHGYDVLEAQNCREAEAVFQSGRPDAAVVDYRLPDGNALELLERLKRIEPHVPVVILTAYGTIELAVRAIKEGAEHFLTKPLELPVLLVILQRLLARQRDRQSRLANRSEEARRQIDPFLGTSAAIRTLAEQAGKVAGADSPVLIQGETGTGKGVLARWLHRHGVRAEEAFVDLNCAGLSRELLENELFGHERGAFTGAVNRKPGLLEIAHKGTVFLDEIGDVDPQIQPRLLTVLEEKRFRRLGDVHDQHVDIRLIAATHRDPLRLVEEGRFRSDLYFRLSTIRLVIPPLRERIEDIPPLTRHLLERCAAELGRNAIVLSADAQRVLQAYPWPGNIRELRNVLERAVLLSPKTRIDTEDLFFDRPPTPVDAQQELHLSLEDVERRHIERVLRAEQGRVAEAARKLGIPRSSLYQKLKRYGIPSSRF